MDRKQFLTTTSLLLGGALFASKSFAAKHHSKTIVIPPYLKKGDTIGITSPSGAITQEELSPAIQLIESWGFQIYIGKTIGKKDGTFGGTDEERRNDFQEMLLNPTIKAILCARGGYGIIRIIDEIDFSSLRKHPKWIIGFSDITVFHAHLQQQQRVATIHSKMCNSFPIDWATADPIRKETILSLQKALMGAPMHYKAPYNIYNKIGKAKGLLLGGNLRTLENLSGTLSAIQTDGKILFLEEVDEQLYNIDRMFWNLKRSGKLNKLAGLIIGGFKIKPDNPTDDQFNIDLQHIVLEKVKHFAYPICFDFPVGHQVNNYALKCGIVHQLDVSQQGTILFEQIIS